MSHQVQIREDHVTSLAVRLKRDQLSSDDFQRELAALSRPERAALVEYLDVIEKGPFEVHRKKPSDPGNASEAVV